MRFLAVIFFVGAGTLSTATLGQAPRTEPAFFYESYEGPPLEVTRYVIEGTLDSRTEISVSVRRNGRNWSVVVSENKKHVSVLSIPIKNYSPIHFSRVAVASVPRHLGSAGAIIAIPYGEAWTSCFANGENVFNELVLSIDRGKLKRAEKRSFENCKPVVGPVQPVK